ncbi:anti-sigma factor [Terriglobus aquaticus]|uniref:Anti-sigma factor domain-containing protein n=1 Tax=Terriglobus aquaticus TaxID=940139 RepID=A0ABW9KLV7_9BACT|nr:anti-sigma factor [Terriglobus aquaticus]
MSMHGFVTEDDLILYAMQALSAEEMTQVAGLVESDPEVAARLAEIQSVLGLYASATTVMEEVPASALSRLQSSVERERTVPVAAAPAPRRVAEVVERSPRWSWSLGLLWAGWAVAAALLVGVGLLLRRNHEAQSQVAQLHDAQSQVASVAAERDRLRNSLQQAGVQLTTKQQEAAQAQSRAAALSAQSAALAAKADATALQAQRAAAKADSLAATANQTEAERKQLGEALTKEQQIAAAAADSQQVLAALADPTALHVTLTVPKEKKRPSGRGTYLASTGTLVFTGSDLSSLPANKVYELWLMPADGSAPIPAGTFRPDNAGNATLINSHFQHVAATGFAITVENAGGSLTPTMPIVLVGAS